MTMRKSCGTRMLFAMGILVALVMILTVSVSAEYRESPNADYESTIVLQDGKIYIDSIESDVPGIVWDETGNKWIFNGLDICSNALTIMYISDDNAKIELVGENYIWSGIDHCGVAFPEDYVNDGGHNTALSMSYAIIEGTGSLRIDGGGNDTVVGISCTGLTINSGKIECTTRVACIRNISLDVSENLIINGGESYFGTGGLYNTNLLLAEGSIGIQMGGKLIVTGGELDVRASDDWNDIGIMLTGYCLYKDEIPFEVLGGCVEVYDGIANWSDYGLKVGDGIVVCSEIGMGPGKLIENWKNDGTDDIESYGEICIRQEFFTVTLDTNGGINEWEDLIIVYDHYLQEDVLPTPIREGYTFLGWYNAIEDGEDAYLYHMNKDIVLYAYWQCDHLATTNGYCNTCGAIVNGIGALAGYTITLGDNIGVNFYMDLTEATIADTTAYMFLTLPNGDTETVYIKDSIPVTKSDKTYYVFPCGVAVKEMTADIKAQLITNTGNTEEYSYTVEKYATYIIANPVSIDNPNGYSQESIALAKALLNYGASAQSKFDYNTDAYANRSLSDEDRIIHDVSVETLVSYAKDIGQAISGVKYEGTSTVWETNTIIRHYFTLDDTTTITFKLGDRELVPVLGNNGMCYVDIDGIVAKNMVKSYQLDISNGIETQTITYSVYSYLYDILKGVYSEVSKTGVKAAYWYSQAAIAYLNSK